jgi:acyl-CoA synthetase (AMP-forming)/AMP-acid ligase II
MLKSHLTVLESSAARYPSSTVFKIPQLDSQGSIEGWQSITYQRFRSDVESYARYWTSVFKRDRIPQRSVIGVWYVFQYVAPLLV